MELRIAGATDAGLVRNNNEDSFLAELPLIAVADGVGGHAAGEHASQLAVKTLASWRKRLTKRGADELERAAKAANHRIFSTARRNPELHGMATTMTCAWVDGGTIHVAHVGDSRAYLLRNEHLEQLTEDQTYVQSLVREGVLSPEEAKRSAQRNFVMQALGGQLDVAVELLQVQLDVGDRLLFSSDGLHDYVDDAVIAGILLNHADPDDACRQLVAAANRAGGKDNVTAVVLDVVSDQPSAKVSRLRRRRQR